MTRILSISSGRADIGILSPVWRALADMPSVDLHVLLTGMHLRDAEPASIAIPSDATMHRGGADLGGGTGAQAAAAMAEIAAFAGRIYAAHDFDLVLATGDRLDMIPAALALLPMDTPLAHLHGGELTFGAIDDRVRHALSKLAHIHCVASVDAAERLNRMGEEAWRIHVTGAPALDELLFQPELTSGELAAELGLADIAGLHVVTVHPETIDIEGSAACDAVLIALGERPAPTVFTAPNSDPGGRAVRAKIEAFAAKRDWAVFHETLGARLYANVMRHADVMIGNSSSGLIESPLFGLPVINVGNRQDGRARAGNVADCPARPDAVARLLDDVDPAKRVKHGASPYGDGRAAPRIAKVLTNLPARADLLYKRFAREPGEFKAPWDEAADLAARTG